MSEISDEITEMTEEKVERVRVEKIELDWIRTSSRAHIDAKNHLLAHPEDLETSAPPVGAISLVRELARQGMPLHEIIRSYQLSSARWFQICSEVLATLTDDIEVLVAESIAVSKIASEYLDHVCKQIAAEYEDERERWLRQEESVRLDRVLAVLHGLSSNAEGAERSLGYRMRQNHLAVIAWVDSTDDLGSELIRAQRAVNNAAALLATHGRPLVVARDARTVWAWIPQPVGLLDAADVEKAVTAADAGARLALGDPASGLAGFISSHRQAVAASDVGRASTTRAVFPYQAVSVLAFLVAEPERARFWVRETLGLLAGITRREEVLRSTVGVYLQSNQSATETSRALNCHKNTVLYRLRAIEQLMGRSIESAPVNTGLAVQAYEWLGTAYFK
ncbi:hypothetical protein CJ178_32240 [Rhodococcus sp. ACPA4]|uniref:PucR family transcriptional regulator n=1 Tax=Rhodococcus sp. ACPA4 TaxID=2028571 RepID=UPI000BB13663|nr:helix-turn-helix domain-containing protein [Rhodococcus sp. ACPA4]PBC36081.1 hypothetical protein CJ178_32240 [Rhodococcus sp. ACPA4]